MKRIKVIIFFFILALFTLAYVQYKSIRTNLQYTNDIKEINQRSQKIRQSYLVLNLLLDIETGARGYQLTGDEKFLAPYDAAEEKLPDELSNLYALILPGEAKKVDELVKNRLDHAVLLIQKKMRNEKILYAELDSSKYEMDRLRDAIHGIVESEEDIIAKKSETANLNSKGVVKYLGVGSVFSFILVLLGAFVVYAEFVKRSKAERQLMVSLATSEAIADHISFGIIASDKSGRILFFNNWAEIKILTGKNGIIRENIRSFLTGFVESSPLLKKLLNGETTILENVEIDSGRNRQIVNIHSSPLMINNVFEGMVLAIVDVTETYKKIDTLSADKLEAIMASRAKSDFLAKMSHEIRTPLNAILGVGDILSLSKLNPEQEKCLEIFQRSAQNLNNLVNDILDLSKIEAGKVEINEAPFSLKALVESCISIMDFKASQKGLLFTSKINSNKDHFLGDEGRIRQIILNLLANAIKFTEVGSVEFEVTVKPLRENVSEIFFSIIDTGRGISEENIGKLFSNYQQETSKISTEYGGTGLGLALSRELARLMKGDIKITSTLGEGSAFVFHGSFEEISGEFIIEKINSNEKLSHIKILLVDDNSENRFIIKKYLNDTDVEITEAVDGEDAIEVFKQAQFDLVFMDINMPKKDGLASTKEIREFEVENNLQRTLIIALSANAMKQEFEKAKISGVDDYLTKPVSRLKLIAMIKKWKGSTMNDQFDDQEEIDVDEDIKALIPSYLENRKKDLATLKSALAQKEIAVVAKIAHNIKGTALSYGQVKLDVAAKELNTASKESDWIKIELLISQIENILRDSNGH